MKVLVACEESQEVCKAFRAKGHEAYSCDIQDCSGGHPEWHIKGDCLPLLNGNCEFVTCGGGRTMIDTWDLIIAHPPCTYLTVTGNRWFNEEKYGTKATKRKMLQSGAITFFMTIAWARAEKIAIENPVGIMSRIYRKPDQIIHPWMFAMTDEEKTVKQTCLWLKGLDPLVPVHSGEPKIAYHEWTTPSGKHKRQSLWYYQTRCLPLKERARAASKTFPGIARAMAEQWGGAIREICGAAR